VTRLRAMAVFEPDGRPKCLLMKSPADMSFPRSTLVFTPSPLSMYTTSSVATFPEAPLAYGQPPRPETEESTALIPICFDTNQCPLNILLEAKRQIVRQFKFGYTNPTYRGKYFVHIW